jgi:signal transduction histidine kinase
LLCQQRDAPLETAINHAASSTPTMSAIDDSSLASPPDGSPTPVDEPSAQILLELDRVVAELALSFATTSASKIEPLIATWLERLTAFLALDRITLYEYSEADFGLHSAYHFRNPGIEPPPTVLEAGAIPAVIAALKRGEAVRYERLSDVPVVDRVGIAPYRFPSVLGAPFAVDGVLGYLTFSTLREERTWHDAVVQRLRTVAEIFAHGVARKRNEQRREASEPGPSGSAFPELLLGIVGHDLRNPLSAVSGLSQLLRAREGLPADVVRRIAAIDEAAKRMNDLIATLLDFGESQLTGELSLSRTATDLEALCEQAIAALLAARPDAQIVFQQTQPVRGEWDPARLAQLVRELLVNALTRAEGGPIRVGLTTEAGFAVLRVHTAGAAGTVIPAAILRQIFEPLAPVPEGQSPWAQSVALRLHIVQQIARSHAGSMTAESSRESGTVFTVRLPLTNLG